MEKMSADNLGSGSAARVHIATPDTHVDSAALDTTFRFATADDALGNARKLFQSTRARPRKTRTLPCSEPFLFADQGIGVVFAIQADRPFAIFFLFGGVASGASKLKSQNVGGRHVIFSPGGAPVGAGIYQKVVLEADDAEPAQFACDCEEYARGECEALSKMDLCANMGNNTVKFHGGTGGLVYML